MPRPRSPTLTDAEARVMSVLWKKERATVADVVGTLKRKRPVSYSTVQTILRILEDKGYVSHQKVARAFIYTSPRGRASGPAAGAEAPGRPVVQRLAESAGAQRARGRSDRARGIEPPEETDRRRIGAPVHVVLNWLTQGVIVAVLAAAALRLIPQSRAQARYGVLWTSYLLVLVLPAMPMLVAIVMDGPAIDLVPAAAGPVVTVPTAWWASPSAAAGLWIVWSCIQAARLGASALGVRNVRRRGRGCPASVLARLPHWSRVGATGRRTRVLLSSEVRAAAVLGGGTPTIAVAPTLIGRLECRRSRSSAHSRVGACATP